MAKTFHKAKAWFEKHGTEGVNVELLSMAIQTVQTAKDHEKELISQSKDSRLEAKGASMALKAALRTVKAQRKMLKAAAPS